MTSAKMHHQTLMIVHTSHWMLISRIICTWLSVSACDFHREQAWVRWTRDHKHGLSPTEAEELLDLLRACAWAPPADGDDPGQQCHLTVNQLKQSSVWKNHQSVRQWLTNYWLPIPEVRSTNNGYLASTVCVHEVQAFSPPSPTMEAF